jgi:hypothetical protein
LFRLVEGAVALLNLAGGALGGALFEAPEDAVPSGS